MVDVLVILKEFSKTLNRENPVFCLQGINFTPSGIWTSKRMGRRCRLLAATCSCAQTPGLLGLKLAWWRHGGGFLKWGYPK